MTEYRTVLEQTRERFPAPDLPLEGVLRRRDRRRRNQRLVAGAVGIVIAIAAIVLGSSVIRSSPRPLDRPSPPPAPRMHNGSIGVFGFTNGVRSLTGTFVFECRGNCSEVGSADWSPDGTRLAFTAACGGGCGSFGDPYHGVHVVDPVRGTDRLVLPGEGLGPLAWSPDGRRIAYVQPRYVQGHVWQGSQIFVMNANGSGQTPLTTILRIEPSTPSWSPDGSRIVYSTQGRVFVLGLDGSAPLLLVEGSNPTWSPDGTTIVYLVGCEVRVTTPRGLDDISLIDLATRPDARGCDTATDLEWSPDGTKLAAMVGRDMTPSSRGVFVVHADGSGARRLTSWSPSAAPRYQGITWRPAP
jgi:Tol biopolymer transport system component